MERNDPKKDNEEKTNLERDNLKKDTSGKERFENGISGKEESGKGLIWKANIWKRIVPERKQSKTGQFGNNKMKRTILEMISLKKGNSGKGDLKKDNAEN